MDNLENLFKDIFNSSNSGYYWCGWYYDGNFQKTNDDQRHCDYILTNPEFFDIDPQEVHDLLEENNLETDIEKLLSFDWESEDAFAEYTEPWIELMNKAYSKGAIRVIVDDRYDHSLDITIKDIKHHKDKIMDFFMDNKDFLKLKSFKHFIVDDFLDDIKRAKGDKEAKLHGTSFEAFGIDELLEKLC